MTRRAPRLWADRRGGVAITAAMAGLLLCGLAAMAVDVGSVALHARRVQGAADLAALAGARDLERARAAAEATARDNLDTAPRAHVVTGVYLADRHRAPDQRFVPGGPTPNAVRVTLESETPLHFGRWLLGRDAVPITRRATAAVAADEPRAMFSIGSRLARLEGGLANQVLGALTGTTVSLTAMDYRALADARINLLTYADALAADLDLTAGDYDALLDAEIDAGRALSLAEPLVEGQDGGALGKLARAADGLRLKLGRLLGVEADAPQGLRGGLDASVSALDLATAMLETATGERQVTLDLGLRPGLARLDASLAIGERPNRSPWLTVTRTGQPIIRTAQARLYVRARTAQSLSGLARVDLPILIELAASEARLDAIACKPAEQVTLGVRPGLARATIGEVDERRLADFKTALTPRPATLLSVAGLVTLTGRADIEAASADFRPVVFPAADIAAQRPRTVTSSGVVTGLISTLIQRLDVDVRIIGLGLGLGDLVRALGTLLTPLGPVLDGVVEPILDALGLKFGEADVTVHGVSCPDSRAGGPVLVG